MGWLFFPKPASPKAYLDNQLNQGLNKVLRSAIVGRTEYYAAVQIPNGDVFAVICLLKYEPRAKDGRTFGYKDMDEACGPYVTRCPKQILVLLTPTTNQYALEWRERCKQYHRRQMIPSQSTLRFKHGLSFTDGVTEHEFVLFRMGRKIRFLRATDRALVRITGWAEREFEVVALTRN